MKCLSRFALILYIVIASSIFSNFSSVLSADRISVDGSSTVGPVIKAFAESYMRDSNIEITVSESGSGNGAKALTNKTCDIASMSRFMKDVEFKAAVSNGVLPIAYVIAYDGIAVIVHPSNPIKNISLSQLRDIYLGKLNNWKVLGSANAPIVVLSRDINSGTFETFETLALKGGKVHSKAEYASSNGVVRIRVQSTPTAIGYVGFGFVDKTVKVLSINNVYPSHTTISCGQYPISRPLYLFTDGIPKQGTHLHRFVNMYLEEEGQDIILDAGYIPVTKY